MTLFLRNSYNWLQIRKNVTSFFKNGNHYLSVTKIKIKGKVIGAGSLVLSSFLSVLP